MRQNSPELILRFVCQEFSMKRKDLLGKRIFRSFIRPRSIAVLLFREDAQYTFDKIGRLFGERHPTTILRAYAQAKQLVADDSDAVRSVCRIRALCARAAIETALRRKRPVDGIRSLSAPTVFGQKFSIQDVLNAVCDEFQIKIEDLTGSSQKAIFVKPRQIAMFLIRTEIGKSFPEIGQKFRRHHTTVIASCVRVARSCEENPGFKELICKISSACATQATSVVTQVPSIQPSAAL
jgi:chromosomal replication initiation ATPase DnaA